MNSDFYKSTSLLFFLLNPLFMSIYTFGIFQIAMESVLTGARLSPEASIFSIVLAVVGTVICIVFLKHFYDVLSQKREKIVKAYVNTGDG